MIWGPVLLSLWYLSLVDAQGDPIPDEIYAALSNTAVQSFDDLRQLLRIDSIEEEHSWSNRTKGNTAMPRAKRSLDVETAVIAECKPRTEVFQISRGLVDPTNANFIVWPPCVEVQRCSGCCHIKTMQCAPAQVQLRHVQVSKIEISPRKKNVFQKVLITLEDHLQCHCQSVAGPARHARPRPTSRAPSDELITTTTSTTTTRPQTTTARTPLDSRERTRQRPGKRKHRKYKHMQGPKTLKEFYAP